MRKYIESKSILLTTKYHITALLTISFIVVKQFLWLKKLWLHKINQTGFFIGNLIFWNNYILYYTHCLAIIWVLYFPNKNAKMKVWLQQRVKKKFSFRENRFSSYTLYEPWYCCLCCNVQFQRKRRSRPMNLCDIIALLSDGG